MNDKTHLTIIFLHIYFDTQLTKFTVDFESNIQYAQNKIIQKNLHVVKLAYSIMVFFLFAIPFT